MQAEISILLQAESQHPDIKDFSFPPITESSNGARGGSVEGRTVAMALAMAVTVLFTSSASMTVAVKEESGPVHWSKYAAADASDTIVVRSEATFMASTAHSGLQVRTDDANPIANASATADTTVSIWDSAHTQAKPLPETVQSAEIAAIALAVAMANSCMTAQPQHDSTSPIELLDCQRQTGVPPLSADQTDRRSEP